ncbi:MAG: glutamate 5-kinase [Myxococcota bacterium]|nr:glutamate 5-kinase [Myxococcota bacterium]
MTEIIAQNIRSKLHESKRLVVKIGSALLSRSDETFQGFAKSISELNRAGYSTFIVSSGAIAQGLKVIGQTDRPQDVVTQQALAALGQPELMAQWRNAFANHEKMVAQILLTHADLESRERFINARRAILALENRGIIPIGNENDTTATEEIRVGDNDQLAAHIANLVSADLLILLTSVDGLLKPSTTQSSNDTRVPYIHDLQEASKWVLTGEKSNLGTGGMQTKLTAAEIAANRGIPTVIANGEDLKILQAILGGEDVGTLIAPTQKLKSRKHWIAYTLKPKGKVVVDEGAIEALVNGGKSLLATGITSVCGNFSRGAMVEVIGKDGQSLARGLVQYNSQELDRIQGLNTDEIVKQLGYLPTQEVIHRDDLVIIPPPPEL